MSKNDLVEEIIGKFGRYQMFIWAVIMLGHFAVDFQINNVLFVLPNVEYVCMDDGALNATNYCPCKMPEYNRSAIFESATSEWNLICERKHLASLAQSLMIGGMLTGSLLYGYLSDRYGRRIAAILALLTQPVFGSLSAFVTEYWMFAACRFMTGNAIGGSYVTCYVLLMELSGKSFRPYLSGLHETSAATTTMLLPLIAYYIREWRYLQLVTSAPWFAVIAFFWILPESPRWLITVGKKKEAIAILTHIAKKNYRSTENIVNYVNIIERETINDSKERRGTYFDLFKTPKIRMFTILNGLIWMGCAHVYFGISQYIGRLNGNVYFNVFLMGLLLVPALAITVVCAVFMRRKVITIVTFIIAGVSLSAFIFLPEHLQSIANIIAILGYVTIYSAFVLIYLYTTEIFPTVVRNSAMGLASVCARIGGFVAPFVVNIGIKWASITVLSVISFFAAFLCCFLPETKDTVLLNSIEQAEGSTKQREVVGKTSVMGNGCT